ncbi:TolC family protein [Parahaliea aestuarii]|uniref:TolC family protein n=1 Tax=Parahaliea aestuarii TaxID=1852021 RepID=A0A5C9A0Q2_9GAMM|nr:TolC family protein [Parahaliea aestuarii]TXS94443.1 TolC family protein [Parahaliea aestuarii]
MFAEPFVRASCLALTLFSLSAPLFAQQPLSLSDAVALAREQDPWLEGSRLRQQALAASEVAAGTLPDPMVSMGAANLPTDTFNFNQEPMTQFMVGVSQALPRGDSLELSQSRYALLGEQQTHLRADRREQVAVTVAGLWLDAWQAQESARLIENDRALFEYLVEVAQNSYANTLGQTRQQDVIRAQLELTRLDDRIASLRQQRDTALGQLGEWLGEGYGVDVGVGQSLPELELRAADRVRTEAAVDSTWLGQVLSAHPMVSGVEQTIAASDVGVELARQKYRPQWGLSASYGYREDAPDGMDRADFFSVGLSFDLPLFTGNRQDQELQSAAAEAEASRTDRALALRRLRAGFEAERARLAQLDARNSLYSDRLLGQMRDQYEAALSAYTSVEGDFAEVVRARIDELNARVEALGIRVERQRAIARLNYYLAGLSAAEETAS